MDGNGPDEALHEEFAREGEHNDVKGHKDEVTAAFAIMYGGGRVKANGRGGQRVGSRERVGEEDRTVERIGGGRVDQIGGEHEEDQDERVDPCVAE